MKPRQTRGTLVVLGSLLLVLAASPSHGAELLRWKFKQGETIDYTMIQQMKMTMTIMGQNVETNMTQHLDMTWTVDKVADDGNATLTQKITRMKMIMEGPQFGKVEVDSEKPGGGNPFTDAMKKVIDSLVGGEFTVTMTPQGQVKDMKLSDTMKQALQAAGGGKMPGGFSEDTFKQMTTQAGAFFPKKNVSKGESWSQKTDTDMPFGKMKAVSKLTYLGTESKNGATMAKLKLEPSFTLEPKPNSPFKVKMTDKGGKGTVYFDAAEGKLSSSVYTQKMQIELTTGGKTIDQNIDQTIRMERKQPESSQPDSEEE